MYGRKLSFRCLTNADTGVCMLETFLAVSEVGSCLALTGTVVYNIDSMH